MYYTVYKITNLINGKLYIGVHKTKDLEDDYMGSGKLIGRAKIKYGVENFKKEFIAIFDNPDDMFNMETELVNESFVQDKNTYNIKTGGYGGAVDMQQTEYYQTGAQYKSITSAGKKGSLTLSKQRNERIEKYKLNPAVCKQCNNSIEYDKRNNQFCSKSCSATFNNARRAPRSEESRKRTSISMKKLHK